MNFRSNPWGFRAHEYAQSAGGLSQEHWDGLYAEALGMMGSIDDAGNEEVLEVENGDGERGGSRRRKIRIGWYVPLHTHTTPSFPDIHNPPEPHQRLFIHIYIISSSMSSMRGALNRFHTL